MNSEIDIEKELQSLGLTSKPWSGVLAAVKAKLPPQDWERFSRLHKNFTGYRSESTLSRFYGFVYSQGLQLEINAYRYGRLKAILEDLLLETPPGLSILDIGAGAGILAAVLKKSRPPKKLVLQDPCKEVRDELTAQGFSVLPHPTPASPLDLPVPDAAGFDLLICADSLGEINSDDDGALAKPNGVSAADLPPILEERYGFAQKLRLWKPYLAPGGRVLLWEPFAYQNAMESLAVLLRSDGWEARLQARSPVRNYLELRLL